MKFPKICLIKYSIADLLLEGTMRNRNTVADLRRKVNILIIDDEDLLVEDRLKASDFHITHKYDIDSIKDVEPYAIILCDIRGVGVKFDSPKEGAFLIREIKKYYPNKQIVAYTGSKYDPTYNEYLKCSDAIIDKGISLDDWINILDDQINKAIDPQYQWERIRQYLLDSKIPTLDVAKLEDKYVQAIKNNEMSQLEELVKFTNEATKKAVADFISSACVKFIFGGL